MTWPGANEGAGIKVPSPGGALLIVPCFLPRGGRSTSSNLIGWSVNGDRAYGGRGIGDRVSFRRRQEIVSGYSYFSE